LLEGFAGQAPQASTGICKVQQTAARAAGASPVPETDLHHMGFLLEGS